MTTTTTPVKPGIRERRRDEAAKLVARLTTQRDEMIAKLVKLEGKLTGARRTVQRYERLIADAKPKPQRGIGSVLAEITDPKPAPTAEPTVPVKVEPPAPPQLAPVPAADDDQLAIPRFLARIPGPIGDKTPADLAKLAEEDAARERERVEAMRTGRAKDEAAIEAMRAEQRDGRKRKARVRDERKAADAAGARKAMPLEGKAALAVIRRTRKGSQATAGQR